MYENPMLGYGEENKSESHHVYIITMSYGVWKQVTPFSLFTARFLGSGDKRFFSSSQCDEGRKRFATVATILLHTMLQKLLSLCTTKSDAHDDDDATLRVSRA